MKHASLAADQLLPWATLNDVNLRGVKISSNIIAADGASKGGGILSTQAHEPHDVLLSIPQELILSKEAVLQCAKTDRHLRQLVEALDDFITVGTTQASVPLFLLRIMLRHLEKPSSFSYSIK